MFVEVLEDSSSQRETCDCLSARRGRDYVKSRENTSGVGRKNEAESFRKTDNENRRDSQLLTTAMSIMKCL